MNQPRSILHVDMDAFYAAVEVLDHPELRGLPVVVGSAPNERGVVSTASYEARVFGIHSAMPSRTAGRLCPHAIFLPVRMGRYAEVSARVMEQVESLSPLFEQVSVDEAFVDLAGALRRWGTAEKAARALKERIRGETGLTASVGVASNKFLAKLASDLQKPDGLTVVPVEEQEVVAFLAPLPVTRIWGVGKVTAEILHRFGLRTMGDVQRRAQHELIPLVGPALAQHLWELAHGRDERPVVTESEARSISSEHTFATDERDPAAIRQTLIEMTEGVGRRLRAAGQLAGVIHIKLRFDDFQTVTRQQKLETPTSSDRRLILSGIDMLQQQKLTRPIRLVGFGVSQLVAPGQTPDEQPMLFPEFQPAGETPRDARLDGAVDRVREKFGTQSLRRGL